MTEYWTSSNGIVHAELVWTDERVVIFSFEVDETGKGHAKAALQEIRHKAGNRQIVAYRIGEVGSKTHSFWTAMCKRGLVDETLQ